MPKLGDERVVHDGIEVYTTCNFCTWEGWQDIDDDICPHCEKEGFLCDIPK